MNYYASHNGRVNIRWTGWRDKQPQRYPLEVIVTGMRQPASAPPSLSQWSDTPRRVIPPPAGSPNPRALVLHWFEDKEPEAELRTVDDLVLDASGLLDCGDQ
jgi:hypothetical protein